jgi:hypothetical protein
MVLEKVKRNLDSWSELQRRETKKYVYRACILGGWREAYQCFLIQLHVRLQAAPPYESIHFGAVRSAQHVPRMSIVTGAPSLLLLLLLALIVRLTVVLFDLSPEKSSGDAGRSRSVAFCARRRETNTPLVISSDR